MSSLMQFNGRMDRKRGVRLEFTHQLKGQPWRVDKHQIGTTADTDGVYMPDGKWYPRIWVAWRRPRGTLGCWVIFRYNGKAQLPDLSCPIGVDKLPRDARPLPNEEMIARWQS